MARNAVSLHMTDESYLHANRSQIGFDSHLQEDTFMTRDKLLINQEDMWRALLGEQRTTLTLAVEMLSRCQLSPEQILTKTMMALEGSQQDS
jgi:hypothetical protein